jgi:hypothetical protein
MSDVAIFFENLRVPVVARAVLKGDSARELKSPRTAIHQGVTDDRRVEAPISEPQDQARPIEAGRRREDGKRSRGTLRRAYGPDREWNQLRYGTQLSVRRNAEQLPVLIDPQRVQLAGAGRTPSKVCTSLQPLTCRAWQSLPPFVWGT